VDFDWDDGNRDKNRRHGATDDEIEQALQDPNARIAGTVIVGSERRVIVLGRARDSGKYLRIVYTVREISGRSAVRPISAVEMTRPERRRYRKA